VDPTAGELPSARNRVCAPANIRTTRAATIALIIIGFFMAQNFNPR
jgi:hypothetical protein